MSDPLVPLSERISGPYHGYYVAAYAVPAAEGFFGYAKVCTAPVGDIWRCNAVCKVGCDLAPSAEAAVDQVEIQARDTIRSARQQGFF
jgi:hypothetical protein